MWSVEVWWALPAEISHVSNNGWDPSVSSRDLELKSGSVLASVTWWVIQYIRLLICMQLVNNYSFSFDLLASKLSGSEMIDRISICRMWSKSGNSTNVKSECPSSSIRHIGHAWDALDVSWGDLQRNTRCFRINAPLNSPSSEAFGAKVMCAL